jgi:hypothetical protein
MRVSTRVPVGLHSDVSHGQVSPCCVRRVRVQIDHLSDACTHKVSRPLVLSSFVPRGMHSRLHDNKSRMYESA